MKTKLAILILSIIYCVYLLTILAASHYKLTTLNPLNSEYYFQKGLLDDAIEKEPTKAEYHINYAFELLKSLPVDKFWFFRNYCGYFLGFSNPQC